MGDAHRGSGAETAPAPSRLPSNRLVETKAIRQEVETILRDMGDAVDAALLPKGHATRFAVRILANAVRHSTVLLCKLVDEVHIAEKGIAGLQARQNARHLTVITGIRSSTVAVIATNIAVGIAVVAAIVWANHLAAPTLVIDPAAGGSGLVHCGDGARDATGDVHCSMDVLVKRRD